MHGDGRLVPLLVEVAGDVDVARAARGSRRPRPARRSESPACRRAGRPRSRRGPPRSRSARRRPAAATSPRGRPSKQLQTETGHRPALGENVRTDDLVRVPVLRRVVPGERAQARDASRTASRRRPARATPTPADRTGASRRPASSGVVRNNMRRYEAASVASAFGALLGERALVAIARRREALGAFERPPVVAVVGGRRQVVRQAAPYLELAVEVAARLERPRQHLAAADVLRLGRQVAAQDDGAARPVLVDEVRVRLIQRDLRVGGGRRAAASTHRGGRRARCSRGARRCARATASRILAVGVLPISELRDVVLAPRLVVASEDVQRLAAQVVKLRIARCGARSGGRARARRPRSRTVRRPRPRARRRAARARRAASAPAPVPARGVPCRTGRAGDRRPRPCAGDRRPETPATTQQSPPRRPSRHPGFATVVPDEASRPRRPFCPPLAPESRRRNAAAERGYADWLGRRSA